jgi:putative transport protein
MLAGALTGPAALGTAEDAVRQGVAPLLAGTRFDDMSGNMALAFTLAYFGGLGSLIVALKTLPRWSGVDLREAAASYEEALGVPHIDEAGLTGLRPVAVRAYRLTQDTFAGWTVRQFMQKYPQFKILHVLRIEPRLDPEAGRHSPAEVMTLAAAGMQSMTRLRLPGANLPAARERGGEAASSYARLGAPDDLVLRPGDVLTIGGHSDNMAQNVTLLGPEVDDPAALNVPLDEAEVVVSGREVEGRALGELRAADYAGLVMLHHIERGGVPVPMGVHLKLRRHDVLFVSGVRSAVQRLANIAGRSSKPCTTTDLTTLAAGMFLGLLVGAISLPLTGARVGLGNVGGLILAGALLSWAALRLPFIGTTPGGARNVLEDFGLVALLAIVGTQAGAVVATQASGEDIARLALAGLVAGTLPLALAWYVGLRFMRINPAVLAGLLAATRLQPTAAREIAREIGSSVPWVGYPVSHAVSVVLLAVLGYVAMVLAA